MDVVIQERKFAFATEYDISGAGHNLRARKEFLSFPARIQVGLASERMVTLQGRFSLIRRKYNFHFADGRDYAFQCEKIRKGVYVCKRGQEAYRLYQHRGLKYSVFRNEEQIAAVTRNRFVAVGGSRFDIRMNRDADLAMVVSMVLAMNTSDGNDHFDASTAIEHERRGSEDKKFDAAWQPN
jgi:hypothetical protein